MWTGVVFVDIDLVYIWDITVKLGYSWKLRYFEYNGYVDVICNCQPLIFKNFTEYLEYSEISKFFNSPIVPDNGVWLYSEVLGFTSLYP